MSAQDALKAGQLDDALKQLQDEVRRRPADAKLRTFLFQLLCVLGEWQRALTQLTVAGDLDASTLMMVQTYREALRCEVYRNQVFAGRRTPMVLGEPDPWFAPLFKSLSLQAEGHTAEAAQLRASAYEDAEAPGGTLNGAPFEWLADGDARLGPCLELIISGRYYWVPFQRIKMLRIEPPSDLRDLVWTPASILWANGGEAVALVPTRYPGSEKSADPAVRLARRTEWTDLADGTCLGLGQRTLVTDAGETALLEVREMSFAPLAGESPVAA